MSSGTSRFDREKIPYELKRSMEEELKRYFIKPAKIGDGENWRTDLR